MKTVVYQQTKCVDCPAEHAVYLCVPPELTADGGGIINAELRKVVSHIACCDTPLYSYYLDYDESQLLDPTHDLVNSEINGLICASCLTSFIDQRIALGSLINTQGITYVLPAPPCPIPPGDPLMFDVVSVVGNIVVLGWHVVTPVL